MSNSRLNPRVRVTILTLTNKERIMIIGVDVSKNKLDIHVSSVGEHCIIKNTRSSISQFMKKLLLKLGQPELIVFEATGGYEKLLQSYLSNQKLPYHKAHPTRVFHFGKSKGYFAKTDCIDAHMLSKYGEQEEIVASQNTNEDQIKMRELSARKAQIKELIAKEKLKLNLIYLDKSIKRSIKRLIKLLEKELALIEKALGEIINDDKKLCETRELLQTVKGVGKEVSTLLITDLPELGQLNREAISCLVGVAPQTKDSGKKQGYRATGQGRAYVRRGLYMAALVAVRHNPRMNAIYEKLLLKGKKKKVALVAVMRKMLIMMNAMVKNQTAWQSDRI